MMPSAYQHLWYLLFFAPEKKYASRKSGNHSIYAEDGECIDYASTEILSNVTETFAIENAEEEAPAVLRYVDFLEC